jgi:PAS domain S-box-containing protein
VKKRRPSASRTQCPRPDTPGEGLLRAVYENSPIGILCVGRDQRIRAVNPAYAAMLEYPPQELIGCLVNDLTHPEDRGKTSAGFDIAVTADLRRLEKRYLTKSGRTVWAQVTSRFVHEDNGEGYYVTIIEDITELKEKEEQIKTVQAKLIQSAKLSSLGEMAGGIAHEINNPLAIILGKARQAQEALRGQAVPATDFSHDLEKIEKTAQRIAKIVRGLRAFSRNAESDPMERASLAQIVDETLELVRARFGHHGIELWVSCPRQIEIACRPAQIAQVLMNLLNNAHDAVQGIAEKWVALDVVALASGVQIRVTDSGQGIPEAIREKMMLPFFTTKEVGRGTGLGLSISKGICEDHQGRLFYDAGSPHTRFVIELPLPFSTQTTRPAA